MLIVIQAGPSAETAATDRRVLLAAVERQHADDAETLAAWDAVIDHARHEAADEVSERSPRG